MNLQRSSRLIATGAVALALIGAGVAASTTDHWGGTQTATVTLPPPPPDVVLTITSSNGGYVDSGSKTVTFGTKIISAASSDLAQGGPGGIRDQMSISSTGTGTLSVSATLTSTMPAAELAKFTLDNAGTAYQLSTVPTVIATQPSGQPMMDISPTINWAGLTQAASGYELTVTYSIDAS